MLSPDDTFLRQMVYGGAILGGGGGGSLASGLKAAEQALAVGQPRIAKLHDLPKDARLATFSRIGTVSGKQSVDNLDREEARALQLFLKSYGRRIDGIIPSEVGALAVTYGLKISAMTGIPVVDAPCNGRAHPLALMGSLGLHRFPKHRTWTVAVGGMHKPEEHIELLLRSNVIRADQVVRNTVANAGVAMASVRNPLPASYVVKNAAIDGLSIAQRLGREFLRAMPGGANSAIAAVARVLRGKIVAEGTVQSLSLNEKSGYSLGHINLLSNRGDLFIIPVCNEYMMVMRAGETVAVFPGLITLFDQETALPLSSGEVQTGSKVIVFTAPQRNLRLGSTMKDRTLLRPIEKLLNIRFRQWVSFPETDPLPVSASSDSLANRGPLGRRSSSANSTT